MSIRAFSSAFLLFATQISTASEGLGVGAVYQCAADDINREMAEACAIGFPELATQANDGLASWRDRNAVKASAAKKACFTDLTERSKTASVDEIAAVNKLIADTKTEIRTAFEARMRSEGKPACVAALRQLKTAAGPLDIR